MCVCLYLSDYVYVYMCDGYGSTQKHAVRTDRSIGQVTIPISWVVQKISLSDMNCHRAILRGWFEMFPYCKPTRLNRYGQYRPYLAGMPLSSGYGVVKPEKVRVGELFHILLWVLELLLSLSLLY